MHHNRGVEEVDLPRQYVISKSDVPAPDGWRTTRLLGWQLQYHPTVPVRYLLDADGNRIGWLTQIPTRDGKLVGDALQIESPSDLERLGGSWSAFLLDRGRVYTNPFGQLALVYSKDAEVIATNPELIPGAEADDALVALMNIPADDNWFPFGLTPRVGVRRLQPNHYLDLNTWRAHRYWPTDESRAPISVDEAARVVARVIRENVAAVVPRYQVRLGLTAGYDSRMILACARDYTDQLMCFTHDGHPWTGELDVAVASRLARRHDLSHKTFHIRKPTRKEALAALYRTGWSVADAVIHEDYMQASRHLLKAYGAGGEVLAGDYYNPPGRIAGPIRLSRTPTPRDLVKYMKLPSNETVLGAAERWLDETGTDDPETILDLLFVEQWLGGLAGILQYRSVRATFWPICHRDVLEVMLRLAPEDKIRRVVHRRVIEREWPDLLALPANEWWGWRKVVKGVSYTGRYLLNGDLAQLINQLRVRVGLRTRMRRWLQKRA